MSNDGEVSYDCSPWAQETRRIMRSLVAEADIPHAWEGTVLVVPAAFRERVDELVESATATARSPLGTARPTAAYEVSLWSAASQNSLVDSLVEAHIPHEWDGDGDLVVHEEDIDEVEALIDELGPPDGGDEIDGLELHERLSKLFVMVDRLARDPHDRRARKGTRKSYFAVKATAVPFGVEREEWLRLHRSASALLDSIASDDAYGGAAEPDDGPRDEVETAGTGGIEGNAKALRDLLRRFV